MASLKLQKLAPLSPAPTITLLTKILSFKMPKRIDGSVAQRAWNILRLALLWARRGGVLKRSLIMDQLRLLPKLKRNLRFAARPSQIQYGERQLSFDETPVFRLRIQRPGSMRFHIPCINPPVDFDHEYESFIGDDRDCSLAVDLIEEDGINVRAEEFIANFYEQLKLQRQVSFLEYHDMQCQDKTR